MDEKSEKFLNSYICRIVCAMSSLRAAAPLAAEAEGGVESLLSAMSALSTTVNELPSSAGAPAAAASTPVLTRSRSKDLGSPQPRSPQGALPGTGSGRRHSDAQQAPVTQAPVEKPKFAAFRVKLFGASLDGFMHSHFQNYRGINLGKTKI